MVFGPKPVRVAAEAVIRGAVDAPLTQDLPTDRGDPSPKPCAIQDRTRSEGESYTGRKFGPLVARRIELKR